MSARAIKLTIVASFLLAAAVSPTAAAAQAWVKPAGETYVKATAGTFQSNGTYNVEGDFEETPFEYSNTFVGLYAEVGVFDFLALSLNTSFYRAVNTVEERTRYIRTGPGDLTVGLHTPIWQSRLCSSAASLKGSFPLYSEVLEPGSEVGGLGVTGEDRFTPALGDGSIDLLPGASFGCAISPIHGWFSTSLGYSARFRGFGDGITYGASIGSFVWPQRLALTAYVTGIQRFSEDAERPTKSYVSFGGGTILRIWGPLAIEAGASYIPAGAFVSRGWSANAGVSFSGDIW